MKTEHNNRLSEELLAAYAEGKTNYQDTLSVLEALSTDHELQEEYFISQQLDALLGAESECIDTIPMTAFAAESKENLCDFQCEEYILKQRAIPYNISEITDEAKNNKWLNERGTPLYNVGRILEQHDLIVMRQYGANISDIKRAISAGHNVIAIVNNNKLTEDASQTIAYHAVVVLSIEETKVTLFDPANNRGEVTFELKRFENAWLDAKSYMARIKSKDFDYNPRPIDLDDVELNTDLIDLREAIAENTHEVWADKRQEEGWRYGVVRNDDKKEHPDMVPYSMLQESEKEYDRVIAFNTIKLVKKLGYDIIKRDDSTPYSKLIGRINNIENSQKCTCGADIFIDQLYCDQCGKKINWDKWK